LPSPGRYAAYGSTQHAASIQQRAIHRPRQKYAPRAHAHRQPTSPLPLPLTLPPHNRRPTPLKTGASCHGGPNLAPYRALRLIGRGAVGEVFLARHAGDGQLYAVKTVPLDAPSWRIELLKREVRFFAVVRPGCMGGSVTGRQRGGRALALQDAHRLLTKPARNA
jgi:serine/threonine protein kinase